MRLSHFTLLLFACISGFGQSITWINSSNDGLWSNPSNWSTGAVPTSSDNVLVIWNQGGGSVFVDGNFFCNNLTITGRTGSGSTSGLAELQIDDSGSLTINGITTLNGGNRSNRAVNIYLGGNAIIDHVGAINVTNVTNIKFELDVNVLFDPTKIIVRSTIPTGITFNMGASTFEYASASNQSIPVYSYHNLILSNGGIKTASGSLDVSGNLTISNSTTFSCNTLNLDSNFVNNGTFTPNTGTVTITGDASTISGTSKTTFYNLVINKTGVVAITGDSTKITNQLQIDVGSITTNNKLVLLSSSASNYAYLIDNASSSGPNGSVNGNIIIQKTINPRVGTTIRGNAGYYSTPFSNSTVGTFNSSLSNFYFMNNSSWVKASSTSQSISSGQGFSRRNAKTGERLFLYGSPNNGTVSISLSTGGTGVNMVGNPYPSSIDWGLVDNSNIAGSGAAYIFNSSGGFNTVTSGTMSIGQGFQVIAVGPTLNFTNSCRITSKTSFLRVANLTSNKFALHLKGDSIEDESFIILNSKATDNFDKRIDAKKMFPTELTNPILALKKDSSFTVIYHLKEGYAEKIIPLFTKVSKNGIFKLSFDNVGSLSYEYDVFLVDQKLNTMDAIVYESSIFDVELSTADSNRFKLVFKSTKVTNASDNTIADNILTYSKDKQIIIKNFSKETINQINIYDISGRKVHVLENVVNGSSFEFESNNEGVYIAVVKTSNKTYTNKILVE